MAYGEEELWNLLRRAYDLPYGAAQIALVEQIVQHADAGGFDDLCFQARMLATTAYVYGGEPAKSFVTFAWCLARYDEDPGRRSQRDQRLLLWHFKYMVNGLTKFPEVPLARTTAVIDDMEQRYSAGGHSMHAVYTQRWRVAHHLGDAEAADEWYARWCATARDENSDCVGCDPTSKVVHLTSQDRDEAAVALAEPVLAGQLTCVEQPQAILTELLVPYLRTSRLDEARDAHRRAYRALRANLADLEPVAQHVRFCSVTGNEARGLELVERHLSWLDRSPSPYATMAFCAAAAHALDRLVRAGRDDVTVHRPASGDRPAGDAPAAELAPALAAQARHIAAEFDRRNGTGHQSGLVDAWLAAEPLVRHLPLSAADRYRPRGAPPGAGADAGDGALDDVRGSAGEALTGAAAATADNQIVYPDDPAALVDLAEQLLRAHRNREAAAAWGHLDRHHPVESLTPFLAARRDDGQGLLAAAQDRDADAEAAWRRAVEGYLRLGDETRRLSTVGRLGVLMCRTGRYDEGLALVEESAAGLADHPDGERRAGAQLRLAHALALGNRMPEALAAVDRAESVAGAELDALLAAEVAVRRAQVLLALDRPDEAASAARLARDRYAEVGDPPAVAAAFLLLGHAQAACNEHVPAAEALAEAIARTQDADIALSAHQARGRALLAARNPAEALGDLIEAVAGFVAGGHEGPAAFTRLDLAAAYHAAGQLLDAAEAAEEALTALDRLGAQQAADRCRYLLSRIYRDMEQPDDALAQLDRLVANLDGFDNLAARAQMHEEAGQVLYGLDRDSLAAQRFGQAADAYRAAELPLDEVRARRWCALSWRWADQAERAVAVLDEADACAAVLDEDEPPVIWEKGMLGYDGARVLIGAERPQEALERLAGVADSFRSIGSFTEAMHVELLEGELLLRLERAGDAEGALRAVLGAAPQGSSVQENAAWLLSEALEALGRTDEAVAVRTEYGLEL
jgi:tetratricopeptide (TPR) repeat protein